MSKNPYNIFESYIAQDLFVESILDRIFRDANEAGKSEDDILKFISYDGEFVHSIELSIDERLENLKQED